MTGACEEDVLLIAGFIFFRGMERSFAHVI